ncbi:hypothetical protein N9L68_08090, partial [bacterium]|nr:hypothetical protein [bacterium]
GICVRCGNGKVNILVDRLVVDRAARRLRSLAHQALGPSPPGVGPSGPIVSAVVVPVCVHCVYVFGCFSIRRTARTSMRRNARAWLLLLPCFSIRRTSKAIMRRKRQGIHAADSQVMHVRCMYGAGVVSFVACCSKGQLPRPRRRHACARHVVPIA